MDRYFRATQAVQVKLNLTSEDISLNLPNYDNENLIIMIIMIDMIIMIMRILF